MNIHRMNTELVLIVFVILLSGLSSYNQDYTLKAKLAASDRTARDNFGSSVGISGNYAIIGAPEECEDASGGNNMLWSGSAYIFERDNEGKWDQVQKIVASERENSSHFGYTLEVSGNYAIIGTMDEIEGNADEDPFGYAGSACYFERDNQGNWNQVQEIVASDRKDGDFFSNSVDISGSFSIIGAFLEDDDSVGENSLPDAGSAYIFERNNEGYWLEDEKIVPLDRSESDNFGYDVSISENTAIISAPLDKLNTTNFKRYSYIGSVYIFERNSNGGWKEIQKIIASDTLNFNGFGASIDIYGKYLIVGAEYDSYDSTGQNKVEFAGSAYFFERNTQGNWVEVQKIVASERNVDDKFGHTVSIDGENAIVGTSVAGYACIFKRNTEGQWIQVSKVISSEGDKNGHFGSSTGISGNYAICGAWSEDKDASGENTKESAGAAYIFENTCIPSNIPDPENIIANGDFEACSLTPWHIYLNDPGKLKVDVVLVDGECQISNITTAEVPETWHIQILQTFTDEQNNRLEAGATYELSFDAVAEAEKEVFVFFGQNEGDPWTACVNETIAIGVEKEHFSYEFTLSSVLPLMRVLFGVGYEPAGLTIDNVRLVKIIPSADNELVVNDPVFHIYPNPAQDVLHIEAANGSVVKLITITGVVMKTIPVTDKIISMDIHEFPEGMYLIKIAKDDFVTQHNIVIQ